MIRFKLFLVAFSAVFRTALLTSGYTYGIESAADNVVTNTWKILNTAASDEDDAVFLQVMAFAQKLRFRWSGVHVLLYEEQSLASSV